MTSTDTWCCSAGICASRPPPSTAAPTRGWPARAPAASPRTTRCRRGPGRRWPGRGLLSTSGGRACSVSSLILVLVSHFYAPSSGFNYLTFKWLFRKPNLENLCNILSSSQCCLKSEQSHSMISSTCNMQMTLTLALLSLSLRQSGSAVSCSQCHASAIVSTV